MSAVLVDCGSGHTGILFYTLSTAGDVLQRARGSLRHADGGNLPVTDCLISESFAEFIGQLSASLASQHDADGCIPDILYVGATGGVRSALQTGKITNAVVESFRDALVTAFSGNIRVVKFEVLTGGQEAGWELQAAQAIWGIHVSSMFPTHGEVTVTTEEENTSRGCLAAISLFSGGGQSMQLGRSGCEPLSFPFSTFPKSMEERQGAGPDAWLDDAIWRRFADDLLAKIKEEAAHHNLFDGCFVATAMNHRAAMFTEIAEIPITAAAAAAALRGSLLQFRSREGPLFERMMATKMGGANYPLARITAMHTYRLATVLEHMFHPEAKMFFARDGVDSAGKHIECEWTIGAFVAEARSLANVPAV